jgi:hypothetical protein
MSLDRRANDSHGPVIGRRVIEIIRRGIELECYRIEHPQLVEPDPTGHLLDLRDIGDVRQLIETLRHVLPHSGKAGREHEDEQQCRRDPSHVERAAAIECPRIGIRGRRQVRV